MEYKQSSISEILESEEQMVLQGLERYGAFYSNTSELANLLGSGMLKSIDPDRFVFAMFFSQVKKHLMLALFSALRLHKVQTMMNLRQVLEAGACASYAIANVNPADFADTRDDGTLNPNQGFSKRRYEWLEANFPAGSNAIKSMKDTLNEIGTHSNIVMAQQNYEFDAELKIFKMPFFDFEDEFWVKTDLWQTGNVALGIMDLFFGVNQAFGVIKLKDDWLDKFQSLAEENQRLKTEMLAHDRMRKFVDQ